MKPEDDSEAGAVKSCETPGCDKEAKLQCPTCIKLQIKVSTYLGLNSCVPYCKLDMKYFPT